MGWVSGPRGAGRVSGPRVRDTRTRPALPPLPSPNLKPRGKIREKEKYSPRKWKKKFREERAYRRKKWVMDD